MADHFETTADQITEASKELGLNFQLVHALMERGHTINDIRAMPAKERFEEFCGWHLGGNGDWLWSVMLECKK